MKTTQFAKLTAASTAANFADQMLLALLPLLLVAAGTEASTVGTVVAAHAAAWLVISLPVGAYADAISRRTIMIAGALAIITGSLAGGIAVGLSFPPAWLLALVAFITASGVVMIILAVFALMPKWIPAQNIASANAVNEFGRAAGSIAAPLLAAALTTRSWGTIGFALAFAGGVIALIAALAIRPEERPNNSSIALATAIRDGAAFVINEPILRAIALCAIAWNGAFFALTAIFAPYASAYLGMTVGDIGNIWSAYGFGLLLGSLAASPMIRHLPTGLMFIFGPAVSCCAVTTLLVAGQLRNSASASIAFFLLGFGPMTWGVLQTSVRQLLTPNVMLGRVGATMSMAIYGVRPLGAIAASGLAAVYGAEQALWLSAALFLISCVALVLSPAARLRAMPAAC